MKNHNLGIKRVKASLGKSCSFLAFEKEAGQDYFRVVWKGNSFRYRINKDVSSLSMSDFNDLYLEILNYDKTRENV